MTGGLADDALGHLSVRRIARSALALAEAKAGKPWVDRATWSEQRLLGLDDSGSGARGTIAAAAYPVAARTQISELSTLHLVFRIQKRCWFNEERS